MINIEKDFKFKQNDKIVIGCSTGPDSMALVDMLLKIRNKYNLSLIIAHVNHNVRKESYEEAEFLKQYCIDNNLESITIRLSYFNINTDEVRSFDHIYSLKDLENFVYEIVNKYLETLTLKESFKIERDKSIKEQILKETHGKCVYCESKISHVCPGDIEHILPKNKKRMILSLFLLFCLSKREYLRIC